METRNSKQERKPWVELSSLLATILFLISGAATLEAQNEASVSASNPSLGGDYTLRSNDLVAVTVFGEPELTAQDRLSSDGSIMLPLVGRVTVSGTTAAGAAEKIRALLAKDYLVNPQVNVSIVEFTKEYFTLLGQVASPGTYALPPSGKLPFLQAVGMAGGFTRIASQSKIKVKRTISGREEIIKVDGKRLASDREQAAFLVLPGDVITVGESLF